MDRRTLLALGLDAGRGPSTSLIGDFNGLPTQQREGQVYSAGGLSHALNSPYTQGSGIARRPADWDNDYVNPGEADPLLTAQLRMGDRGGMARGASAFLGTGFNPWTQEMGGPEGSWSAPAGQENQIDALFDTAQMLGLDTSKYSRNAPMVGIRGERSGEADTMQLWDDLNALTKDYVSIDHMTDDGKSMVKQLFLERDGQLIPVSDPQARSGRQDSAFFDDEFKNMLMTIGPAVVGGFMAAPAAGAGQAAGSAGSAGAAGGAAAGTGAAGSIPWSEIGSRALRGALTGGLTSGLQGGNILQGALMGGLSGGASAAGIPSGILSIGKNVLSGALGMGGGGSGGSGGGIGGAGGGSGSASAGASAPVPGASALGVALGGGGSSTGDGYSQLFNPDDARQRYLVNALRLNRSGKAGDQSQDRAVALRKALEELT